MIDNMESKPFFLIAAALFLSLFSVFASGGGEPAEREESRKLVGRFSLISLQPGRESVFPGAGNSADEILAAQLFTGPLEFDPGSGLFVPALAAEWQFSPDRLSCRLRLGEHFWSDGSAISAYQLRASWIHVLKSGSPASAFLASCIRGGRDFLEGVITEEQLGIRIGDGDFIDLEFERPCGPEVLAAPAFYAYPAELFETSLSLYGLPEKMRSSGAYELAGLEEGLIILTLRNDRRIRAPRRLKGPEEIRIIVPESPVKALELYRDQYADWLTPDAFPSQYTGDMEGRADYHEPAGFISYFFILNGKRSPLNDRELREILIGSIDRGELLSELNRGARIPAFSVLPPGLIPGMEKDGFRNPSFEESGADGPPGDPVLPGEPLILICPSDRGHRLTAEALIRQWRDKAGITVNLKLMSGRDFLEARKNGGYHLAPGGWFFSSPDPSSLLLQFLPGALYGGYGGDAFEKACIEAVTAKAGESRRRSLIKDAERVLVSGDSLILPLFFGSRPQLIDRAAWKGFEPENWYPPRLYRLYRY